MATLIAPLTTGFSDAVSGNAYFYSRATGNPAMVYEDPEGEEAIGTSAALGPSGEVVCYAKESVDVRVKNAAGSTVREFTNIVSADSVTVESDSLTGTLPSGSQGAGGTANLQERFDRMVASFGALDFLVRKTGGTADQFLKDALVASATSIVYNVKDSAYGAAGDNSADDTAEIQAAINAAEAAGGGIIFFPVGIYRISGPLVISSQKVILWGVHHRASIIRNTSSTLNAISISSGSTNDCGILIQDLGIDALTSSTGSGVNASVANGLELHRVRVAGHTRGVNAASRVRMVNCTISTPTSGVVYCVEVGSGGTGDRTEIIDSQLTLNSTAANGIAVRVQRHDVRIEGCAIDVSAGAATSKGIAIDNAAGTNCQMRNCSFTAGAGNYGIYVDANVGFYELGNRALSGTLFGASGTLTRASAQVRLTPMNTTNESTNPGANYSASQDIGLHVIIINNNTDVAINPSGGTPTHGQIMKVMVFNEGAAAINVTTTDFEYTATVNVAAGDAAVWQFIYINNSTGQNRWFQLPANAETFTT